MTHDVHKELLARSDGTAAAVREGVRRCCVCGLGPVQRVRENFATILRVYRDPAGLPEIDAKKSIIGVHGFPMRSLMSTNHHECMSA